MKKQVSSALLMDAGSASGTNTIVSSVMRISMLDNIGLQFNVAGTPVGTATVQVSVDHVEDELGNVKTAGNWCTLTTQAINGAANIYLSDSSMKNLAAAYLKISYTNSSSTGTITIYACGKSIG